MILEQLPPNHKQIKFHIDMGSFAPPKGTIYAYHPFIYNPDNTYIDPPLLVHEFYHLEQQKKYGVKKWWNKYLKDKHFRLDQELPAYQIQFHEIKRTVKQRDRLHKILYYLAKDLAQWGIITHSEAMEAIKSDKLVSLKKTSDGLGNKSKLGKLLSDHQYNKDVIETEDAQEEQIERKMWEKFPKKVIFS